MLSVYTLRAKLSDVVRERHAIYKKSQQSPCLHLPSSCPCKQVEAGCSTALSMPSVVASLHPSHVHRPQIAFLEDAGHRRRPTAQANFMRLLRLYMQRVHDAAKAMVNRGFRVLIDTLPLFGLRGAAVCRYPYQRSGLTVDDHRVSKC
jgi:hypothetical protein